jgi:hypothetical protein
MNTFLKQKIALTFITSIMLLNQCSKAQEDTHKPGECVLPEHEQWKLPINLNHECGAQPLSELTQPLLVHEKRRDYKRSTDLEYYICAFCRKAVGPEDMDTDLN